MRKVKVLKYEKVEGSNRAVKVFDYEAYFHEFGSDFEEFEDGAGNYSTAIVECENGVVCNVPVEMIRFITSPNKKLSEMKKADK